jgi:hypothetical protein
MPLASEDVCYSGQSQPPGCLAGLLSLTRCGLSRWSLTIGEALRYAGYRRSEKILEQHRAKVEHLALVLAEQTELDQDGIARILAAE